MAPRGNSFDYTPNRHEISVYYTLQAITPPDVLMMQPTTGLSSMPTAAAVAAAAVTAKITAMDAQQQILVSSCIDKAK